MAVQRHYDRLTETLHVADMTVQVLQTLSQSCGIRFFDVVKIHTTVHLQALGGGDNHHKTRLQTRLTTFDVEELLSTEVGTEACLCHHIVAVGHGHLGSQDAAASVSNVGKRTTVDEGRRVLCCLHEVGHQGIAQQHRNGTCHTKVLHLEQLAVGSDAKHDILNAALQVLLTGSQTEDSHQFGCRRDVKACLRHHPVASQSSDHVTQSTVVDVEHTLPENLAQ